MNTNDYEHFFGFASEAFMLDWVVAQFDTFANTIVKDKRDIVVTEDWEGEGCCELCYSEEVHMTFRYQDAALWYKGVVTVSRGYRDFVPDYDPFDVDTPR